MVWHIFRKDLKLLGPMTAGVVLLYVMKLVAEAESRDHMSRVQLAGLAAVLAMAAIGLLVAILVQKDAVPGVRQDWLVRPIRRRDLMLAKIAFVVLTIQVPIFIADFINGLTIGFPPGLALEAAFGQGFRLLFGVLLPLLAFATLTSSLMEALAGAIAIALGVTLLALLPVVDEISGTSGIAWIPGAISSILLLAGAVVIVALQYFGRKTLRSRAACGLTVVLVMSMRLVSWSAAFAIQERLSPEPEAARAIQIRFATDGRKPVIVNQGGLLSSIDLPLDITGVGRDETLVEDRTESRVVERDGSIHPLVTMTFGARRRSRGDRSSVLTMPRETLQAGARIEIDYSLTLMRLTSQQSMPPNGTKLLEGIGLCTTSAESDKSLVPVDCRLGVAPALMRWSPEGPSLPDQDWPGDYSPFPSAGLVERQTRFGPAGTWDGVNWQRAGSEIKISRVVMKAYEPVAHFRRHLSIPVSQIVP